MSSRIRAYALTTVMAVLTTSLPAGTAFAAAPAADTSEAKRLYNEGKSFYDVGEYEKAVELWKQAYTKLDDSAEMQTVRHTLVYNILEAEIRVYEVSNDVTHLRRAKTLLETYLAKHKEIYEDTAEAQEERQSTEKRLAEVEQMLAEAEARAASAPPPSMAGGPASSAEKKPDLDLNEAKLRRLQEIEDTPELKKKDRMYKGFIIGGAVGVGVGGIMVIAGPVIGAGNLFSAANEGVTDPLNESGDTAASEVDGSGAAVFLSGLALAGIGTGFLVAGVVKRKKLHYPKFTSTVSPYAGRHGFGVNARVNF